jgi:peptide/nickel transport system permease protein
MSAQGSITVASRGISLRLPRLLRSVRGVVGVAMLGLVMAVALLGPVVAPYELDDPIGFPGAPPSGDALLGTDFIGRDVLSRILYGGLPLLVLSAATVALTYGLGVSIGMAAGLSRPRVDAVLMRTVDLFISVPQLLLLMVLITGAGSSNGVLILGSAMVLFPGVSRLVRAATLEVSTTGYVEAAVARGERTLAIMRREIFPNIAPYVIADAGVRSVGAIYLIASVNFLGLGSQPPAANWAFMIAENRVVIGTNILAAVAPALMIALLAISVNLIGDAYVERTTRSDR